ncbi:MAG: site-specific DNA-methyltransferase [Paludibacteraceae bacterium]|nr:site-specific DNA-methyltransferase [Paludibacteraceae bacterium]
MTEQEYLQQIHELEKQIERLQTEIKKNSETQYGLRWMDVPEAFEAEAENAIPTLEEVPDKAISNDDGKPTHILIEGDNFHALTCLNYTHKGTIDVIYIDPPYNTGSDGFVYKDKRVLDKFPDGTTVPTDHPLRHSYWLSFMHKRLELAKNLLAEDGFIAISIDDNEYANLKLLCDKVFGESNYLATFHIQVRYSDKSINEEKDFKPLMEYILFYRKSNKFIPKREVEDYGLEKFCFNITECGEGTRIQIDGIDVIVFKPDEWKLSKVDGHIDGLKETWITGSIYSTMSYGKVFQKVIEPRVSLDGLGCLYKVLGRGDDGLGYRYYTGPAKATATKGKMFSGIPLEKRETFTSGINPKRFLPIITSYDFSPEFGNIRTEGGIPFNGGKKPVKMLKQIIDYQQKKDAKVLDFFAGSGSTLEAVLRLNEDDKGKRQFIIITNNEGNICDEKTYPRCINVINGFNHYKGLGNSMKYYRTAFVGEHKITNITDADKVALTQKAGCLLALGENNLEEIKTANSYQIFQLRKGDKPTNDFGYTAVYFSGNLLQFADFRREIEQIQAANPLTRIAIYVFTWGDPSVFENEFDDLSGITIKPIPQPILEIYQNIHQL